MPRSNQPGHTRPALLDESYRAPRSPTTLVSRPRLYTLLDEATRFPVTLLISPAGTGKTTLLAAWVERMATEGSHDIRWLTAHQDLVLEQHLLRAVGSTAGEARGPTDSSRADESTATRWLLLALEEALGNGHPQPGLIIVDDADLLAPAQLALITDIVERRPDVVRLLLASRRDLALPLVALEVRGAARMLRARDLHFTDEEASELIQAHSPNASAAHVQLLQERAHGWAAALILGARTLAPEYDQGGGGPSLARTDQPVLDFLLSEVFKTLPRATRRVLLSTFDEPVITPKRAALLSGDPNAGEVLSDLATEGVLVIAYAQAHGGDPLVRYHPLLVELLRRRVASGGADAAVAAAAHRRAAVYDAANGRGVSALQQATAAGDAELLAGLLVEHGVTLLCAAQLDTVAAALAELPADALDRFPQLLGVAGLYRRTIGDIDGAVLLAARAIDASQRLPSGAPAVSSPIDDALRADALLLRLWQSRFGWQDADAAIASAHEILGTLDASVWVAGGTPTLVINPSRIAWLMMELAAVEVWKGDLPAAAVHIDEAVVTARAVGYKGLLAAALSDRALIQFISGAPQTAAVTADKALAHAADAGLARGAFVDQARLVLGWAAFFRMEFDEARERLIELDESGWARVDVVVATYTTMLQAFVMTESGRVDEARQLVGTAPEAPGPLPMFLLRALALLRLHIAATAGDTAGVTEQLSALSAAGFAVEVDLFNAIVDARIGDVAEAIQKIEQLVEAVTPTDPVMAAAAAAERAAHLLRTGDRASARKAVVDVLSRVAPQRTVYAMTAGIRAAPDFLQLLSEEGQGPDAHPFATQAFEALSHYQAGYGATESHVGSTGEDRRASALVPAPRVPEVSLNGFPVKLTARETDVLEQLALGSSYTEIGTALFITENTVKTHLASLYRKFGVDKRSAALRVARRLELLS